MKNYPTIMTLIMISTPIAMSKVQIFFTCVDIDLCKWKFVTALFTVKALGTSAATFIHINNGYFLHRYRSRSTPPVELVGGPRPAQLVSEADTLPSLREQEQDDDDNNTSPSDDNVFESPAATLETRAQVSGKTERSFMKLPCPFGSQWEG